MGFGFVSNRFFHSAGNCSIQSLLCSLGWRYVSAAQQKFVLSYEFLKIRLHKTRQLVSFNHSVATLFSRIHVLPSYQYLFEIGRKSFVLKGFASSPPNNLDPRESSVRYDITWQDLTLAAPTSRINAIVIHSPPVAHIADNPNPNKKRPHAIRSPGILCADGLRWYGWQADFSCVYQAENDISKISFVWL